jgi:small subunit ribosomal protein S19
MVIKESLYQGKRIDELKRMSLQELSLLLPSDARRKINRLTEADKKFVKKVEKSMKPVKTHKRNMLILPVMVGKSLMIHDGKSYQQVLVTDEMIGHRIGEFALTRRRVQHNAPGIGATRSSSSLSVK